MGDSPTEAIWNKGNIIFLNGTSSSGKTEIAKARGNFGRLLPSHRHRSFLERVPPKFHVYSEEENPSAAEGILWVLSEGGQRVSEIRIGPAGFRLRTGIYRAVAALATAGNDLIIDDVVHDSRVLREAVHILQPFNVLFVGVRCPFEVAEQRERERSDRRQGLVEAHYDLVHSHGVYDLEVDTSTLTPMECANQIKHRLRNGPAPDALRRLREILPCR